LGGPKHPCRPITLGPDHHMGRDNFGGNRSAQCNLLGECGFGDAASSLITLGFLVIIVHAKIKVTHCIIQVRQYQKQSESPQEGPVK